LIHTNYLNYKRTIGGTIAEILVPVMLIFMLSVLRLAVLPVVLENIDLYQLKKPYFPLTKFDNNT